MLQLAIQAAKEAGSYLCEAQTRLSELTVEQKQPNDYVTEVDRQAEAIVASLVRQSYPDHAILGEEFGLQGSTDADYIWVIDPLDGTTNFLRSISHFAVSIAVVHQGEPIIGVVYDPVKRELFSAEQNAGAYLNGERIVVSDRPMKGALLATGVPYSGERLDQLGIFQSTLSHFLAMQTSGLRRLGAAALDLAYVAAGRYEGFWEASLNQWDIAAGVLLVKEAGGKVSSLRGRDDYMLSGNVLATNHVVFDTMLSVTRANYGS